MPNFISKVPRHIRAHFEAVRGTLVNGYFYLPLCTLAIERLHHAAERAVLQKYKETNCRIVRHKGRMIEIYQGLARLRRIEIISKWEFHEMDSIRKFRNHTGRPHPKKKQNLRAAGIIADRLKPAANLIINPSRR